MVTTPTMQKVMADRLRPWAADIILIDDQQDEYDAMSGNACYSGIGNGGIRIGDGGHPISYCL